MCEIICKAIDATHPDPVKDQRGCYKRGMPVAVYPDGTRWGNEEKLPKFFIIKLPGIPVEDAQKYVESHQEPQPQTMKLNKLVWERSQTMGIYYPFLSMPTVIGDTSKTETITVNMVQWLEQDAKGEYAPFYTKPEILSIEGNDYRLRGTVVEVELSGEVMVSLTRRLWKIDVDKLPTDKKNKLNTLGELVIKAKEDYIGESDLEWEDMKKLFKNQKTAKEETKDLWQQK